MFMEVLNQNEGIISCCLFNLMQAQEAFGEAEATFSDWAFVVKWWWSTPGRLCNKLFCCLSQGVWLSLKPSESLLLLSMNSIMKLKHCWLPLGLLTLLDVKSAYALQILEVKFWFNLT